MILALFHSSGKILVSIDRLKMSARESEFLVTISSTSSDSEMNVDSEDSEICYIAEDTK